MSGKVVRINMEKRNVNHLWLESEAHTPQEVQPIKEVEKARRETVNIAAIIARDKARLAQIREELKAYL
jgi:hypothetical protein